MICSGIRYIVCKLHLTYYTISQVLALSKSQFSDIIHIYLDFSLPVCIDRLLFLVNSALLCRLTCIFLAFYLLISVIDNLKILFRIGQILKLSLEFILVSLNYLLLFCNLIPHVLAQLLKRLICIIYDITHSRKCLIRIDNRCCIHILSLSACIPDYLVALLSKLSLCMIAALLSKLILVLHCIYTLIQLSK